VVIGPFPARCFGWADDIGLVEARGKSGENQGGTVSYLKLIEMVNFALTHDGRPIHHPYRRGYSAY